MKDARDWALTADGFWASLDDEIGWTEGNDVMMVAKFVAEALELPTGEPGRTDWVPTKDLLAHWHAWATRHQHKQQLSAIEFGRVLREVNRAEFDKRCKHFNNGHRYFIRLKTVADPVRPHP